jgi:hypothetical protein
MKTHRFAWAVFVVLPVLFGTACGKRSPESVGGHAHHEHKAPHGGTLIELGEHAYSIELLRDRSAGKLTAWVLDGHAENFVRLKAPSIQLIAMPGGKYTPLPLQAVANPSTGESLGDTSQFEAQADWLKTADEFAGILTVEIKGVKFDQVPYTLP